MEVLIILENNSVAYHYNSQCHVKIQGVLLFRSQADATVKDILEEKECSYRLVPFQYLKTSFQGSSIRSAACENFLILCHSRSSFHAGWIVCPYARSGVCPITEGVLQIDSKTGGNYRFICHMRSHENPAIPNSESQATLSLPCPDKFARKAMLTAVLNLKSFSFTDKKEGMTAFLQSVFEAGQSIPLGVRVDRNVYVTS